MKRIKNALVMSGIGYDKSIGHTQFSYFGQLYSGLFGWYANIRGLTVSLFVPRDSTN